MSNRCPWARYPMHRYSDSSNCYLQHLYEDAYLHIARNVPYSADPAVGRPLYDAMVGLDAVKLKEFGLNHRLCNVESAVNEQDTHLAEFRPRDATELWTVMRNVYLKWERVYEDNGRRYWPCRSQAADMVIDGHLDVLRCLQPTRFVTDRYKLAQSLLDLLFALATNFYAHLIESTDGYDLVVESVRNQKVRRIECNAADKASAFFARFDPDRLERVNKRPDQYDYGCGVKRLADAVSGRVATESGGGDPLRVRPPNFAKRVFHYMVTEVFTGHREHVHMLLCHRFLADDPVHCDSWLRLMMAVAENKLQHEGAQARLIAEVKRWKSSYDHRNRGRSDGSVAAAARPVAD